MLQSFMSYEFHIYGGIPRVPGLSSTPGSTYALCWDLYIADNFVISVIIFLISSAVICLLLFFHALLFNLSLFIWPPSNLNLKLTFN